MTIGTESLKVSRLVVSVIAVDVVHIQLTWVSWYEAAGLAEVFLVSSLSSLLGRRSLCHVKAAFAAAFTFSAIDALTLQALWFYAASDAKTSDV